MYNLRLVVNQAAHGAKTTVPLFPHVPKFSLAEFGTYHIPEKSA